MVKLIPFLLPFAIILLGSGILLLPPTRGARACAIIAIVFGVLVFAAMLI
jgi:hypothetical protein